MAQTNREAPVHSQEPDCGPVNDNRPAPADAIAFTDLALAMGVDEDTLLQRLAMILSKREDAPSHESEGEQL